DLPHVFHWCPGQRAQRRVAPEKLAILGDHAIHLRLLQHDLGDQHAVGMARAAPGKVAAVLAVPGQELALEGADGGARRRSHAAQSSTPDIDEAAGYVRAASGTMTA